MKRKLFLLTMLIALYACQDRQPTNPLIQGFDVPVPELQSITAINDQTAELKWSYTNERATSFQIYRGLTDKNLTAHALTDSFCTTWQDSGLVIDTTYYYKISAHFDENESELSNTKTVMTSFPGLSSLTVQAINDAQMQVSWQTPENYRSAYKIQKFRLERKTMADDYQIISLIADSLNQCIDSTISLGILYQYRLSALTSTNQSPYIVSEGASSAFPSPTNLTAEAIDDQSIKLTWLDNCTFEAGYRVERDAGSGFVQIAELGENAVNYTDSGLQFGKTYQYRLAAYTAHNTSSYINTQNVSTVFPAPTNLTSQTIDDQSIRLTWTDNCSFEAGFFIERSDNNKSFVIVDSVNANIIEYADTELEYDEDYRYRVRAYTSINPSLPTNETVANTSTIPAPSTLNASAIDDQSIQLTWMDNCTFETGYRLERDSGSGFVQIAELGENITQYTDIGLVFGKNYQYRVRAYTSRNVSAYETLTQAATIFPAPSNLAAEAIDDQSIKLTWTDNCSFEAGYRLERDRGSGFVQIAELAANTTQYTDNGLTYGTSYQYRVRAYTLQNTSAYETLNQAATIFPEPSNLSSTAIDDQSLSLSWTDNCTFESGFRLERSSGSGFQVIADLNENTREYTDSGLTYGITYQYRLYAITETNRSNYSNVVSGQTVFPAPGTLSAAALDDQSIKLTWKDNYTFESGYMIYRKNTTEFILIAQLSANTSEYIDSGLTYGSVYVYKVRAFTSSNLSDFSNTATGQTIFPAPSDLEAVAVNDQTIALNWQDNCGFESGFIIERSDNAKSFFIIDSVEANVLEYLDTGLAYEDDYRYRVRAFTDRNLSPYSNEIGLTLVIPAPYNLSTEALDDQSIKITWNDNCTFEAGYRLERDGGSDFIQIAELGENTTEYTDTGLSYGTNYTYRVKAYTTLYESDYSAESIGATVFPAPTNLVAEVLDDQIIRFTWDDNCSFENGYRLEQDDGMGFIEIAEVNENITEYSYSEQQATGIILNYRVKAFTAINESDNSNEVDYGIPPEGFVFVRGGSFNMGDIWNDGEGNEKPVHTVTLSPYFIAKHEVTQEKITNILGEQEWSDIYGVGNTYPAYNVSWYEAIVYCNKLSIADGLSPVYSINGSFNTEDWGSIPSSYDSLWDAMECEWSGNGYRLPTEAEWEYAAGGGFDVKNKWSGTTNESDLPIFAWYLSNSNDKTNEVGTLQSNNLGINDMSGNVWELCWDLYDIYLPGDQENPTGPGNDIFISRVGRGGGYNSQPYSCRISRRSNFSPYGESPNLGFRIVRR
jgi:formylglycine-generating enzyme required for sulfatase activity/lipopolysaccharide export LptBFGC system permease protein LptF